MTRSVDVIGAGGWAADQESDIQGSYATVKGACGEGAETRVEIADNRITGPDFDCALLTEHPGGSGIVGYEAICSVDGKTMVATRDTELPALDLGNYEGHFELALPGGDGWLAFYPCAPAPGLN